MAPKYLRIDAELDGTGLVDALEGTSYDPEQLGLSSDFSDDLRRWLDAYWRARYAGFDDPGLVAKLDAEGLALAARLAMELPGAKIGYYSDALAKQLRPVV